MAQSEGSKGYSDTQKWVFKFRAFGNPYEAAKCGYWYVIVEGHLHNFGFSAPLLDLFVMDHPCSFTRHHESSRLCWQHLCDASRKVNRSKTIPKWRNSPLKGTNHWFSWFEPSHRPSSNGSGESSCQFVLVQPPDFMGVSENRVPPKPIASAAWPSLKMPRWRGISHFQTPKLYIVGYELCLPFRIILINTSRFSCLTFKPPTYSNQFNVNHMYNLPMNIPMKSALAWINPPVFHIGFTTSPGTVRWAPSPPGQVAATPPSSEGPEGPEGPGVYIALLLLLSFSYMLCSLKS